MILVADVYADILLKHPHILVLTIGLPRSGKSTWSRQQGFPIVNPDSIRLALHGQRYIQQAEPYVWAIAHTMVDSLFLAGHQVVILDATNTTAQRRQEWASKNYECYFKHIDTAPGVCITRANDADDQYIIPIIVKQAEQFEPLNPLNRRWP